MANENKVGIYGDGVQLTQWPDVTISGRSYRQPVSLMRSIGNGRFVVLDQTPPPGFDVAKAITELQAQAEVLPESAPEVSPSLKNKKVSDEQ